MMRTLSIVILMVAVTVVLMFIGLSTGRSAGTVGVAAGTALPGFSTSASTPEQALNNFLLDVQRRNWDRAFSSIERTSDTLNEQAFIQEWIGSNGGLRSFSSLERFDTRPLHATDSDAQMRVRLHWTTPVGPVENVRDFKLAHRGDSWRVIWDEAPKPNVPAQIVPVNYLRWDLVSGTAGQDWGSHSVDAPNVRIVLMNAVDS